MRTEQYTDTITSTGIEADEAESLWAYKRWRFRVVARAAYVLALHRTRVIQRVRGDYVPVMYHR